MSEDDESSGSKGMAKGKSSQEALVETNHIHETSKNRRPKFLRQESWRYKRLNSSWRKPKGIDSKMRVKKKGWPKSVEVGYRSPRNIRGLHPSGFEEVIIYNVNDLEKINLGNVARIGHTVGLKKRSRIVERAKELKIHILNPRGVGEVEPKESEKTGS
jgi:large subunit ribosomal protein L32e